jgi:hypothetical protein
MSIFSKIFNKESEGEGEENPALLEQSPEAQDESPQQGDELEKFDAAVDATQTSMEAVSDEELAEMVADEEVVDEDVAEEISNVDVEVAAETDGADDELVEVDAVVEATPTADDVVETITVTGMDAFLRDVSHLVTHLRSLRIAIDFDDAGWTTEFRTVTESLLESAKTAELEELAAVLETFAETLGSGEPKKEDVVAAYGLLIEQQPQLFAYESDRGSRQTVVLDSLLRLAGANHLVIDRLKHAGATTLLAFAEANRAELAEKAQVDVTTVGRAADAVVEYQKSVNSPLASPRPLDDLKMLKDSFVALRKAQRAFANVDEKWSEEAIRSRGALRRGREDAFVANKVVLARLGETELVRVLERVPFDEKLSRLEGFLRASASRHANRSNEEKKEEGTK